MNGTRERLASREPALPERFLADVTVAGAFTLAVIAIMALAAFLTLDRSIHLQQQSATAIELTDRERTLSQRVASLAAQYVVGNSAVRRDLRSAIDAFESTHRRLIAGDRNEGIRSVGSDPALGAVYFGGAAPLDAAIVDYVTRARRVAAMPPHDVSLAARAGPVFLAAQRPLLDAFDEAAQVRQDRTNRQSGGLRIVGAAICAILLASLVAASLAVFQPMARRIVQLKKISGELAPLAATDPLTGMLNKRSFQAQGAIEIEKARRYGRPLSLLMIDADTIAAIEAMYGPDGGDTVRKALGSTIFADTRASDIVGRVDTEQFAILLPDTACEGARVAAERLRRKVNDLTVPVDGKLVSSTVSIGVAGVERDASFLAPTFKRADEALYEAQMSGRNRVVVAAAA